MFLSAEAGAQKLPQAAKGAGVKRERWLSLPAQAGGAPDGREEDGRPFPEAPQEDGP